MNRANQRLEQAASGDQSALAEVFAHDRNRLKKMAWLRLERRLQGRVDPSDLVQEVYFGSMPDQLSFCGQVQSTRSNLNAPAAVTSSHPTERHHSAQPSFLVDG